MIEVLIGKILYKNEKKVILNCSGTGYGVNISTNTYSALKKIGEEQTLHTILKVREDDMSLFGFSEDGEKEAFLLLSSVSGVGSKTAIQILSDIKYERLYTAVLENDITLISSAHGIGKKTAQKIALELKDKVTKLDSSGIVAGGEVIENRANSNTEAVHALITLGYKNSEAASIVSKITKGKKNMSTQDIITQALKQQYKK